MKTNKLFPTIVATRSLRIGMTNSLCLLLAAFLTTITTAQAFQQYDGGTYRQDFEQMLGGWANNLTVPGWYKFQSRGNEPWPERPDPNWENGTLLQNFEGALGMVPGSQDLVSALVLRNNSSNTFNAFTLSCFGEQWAINDLRSNGKLEFSYGFSPSLQLNANIGGLNPNTIIPHRGYQFDDFYKGYWRVSALDVYPFQFGNEGRPLDGNSPANRRQYTSTESGLCWIPGEYLILRWFADGFGGSKPVLAVDDLEFTTTALLDIKFRKIERLTNGQVRLTLVGGTVGESCRFESSSDLVNWTPFQTVTNTVGIEQVIHTNAVALKHQFYRAVKDQ